MKTNDATRATAEGMPHPNDPLLALVQRFGRLYRRREELEEKQSAAKKGRDDGSSTAKIYLEAGVRQVSDEVDAIFDMLPYEEARSAAGAMTQINAALTLVRFLDDTDADEIGKFQWRQRIRRIERLLQSAMRFNERQADISFEDLGLINARNRFLDVWEPVEDVIVSVLAEIGDAS